MTPDDPNFDPSHSTPLSDHRTSHLPAVASAAAMAPAAAGAAWLEEPDSGEGIRFGSLLHSLRRRWLLATGWGIFAAAIAGVFLWWFIAEEYEAVAYLQVRQKTDEILGDRGSKPTDKAYEIYKETQKQLIRGPFVLRAALRLPGISQLPMIRNEDGREVEWLMDELIVVTSPETQMIKVGLRGPNIEEPKKIVNAIVKAYEEQIIHVERQEQLEMKTLLERELMAKTTDYDNKQNAFNKLAANTLAVADDESTELAQRLAITELSDLSRKKQRIEDQFSEAKRRYTMTQAAIQMGRKSPGKDWIEDELEQDYEYAEAKYMIDQLEDQYRQYQGLARSGSASLMRLEQQIALAKRELEKIKAEKQPRVLSRIQRRAGADPWSADALLGPLQSEMMALGAEMKILTEEYDVKRAEFSDLSRASVDLLAKKRELESLEEFIAEAEMRVNTLRVNLQEKARVKVLQQAEVPESSNWKVKWVQIGGACFLVFGTLVAGIALWDYQAKRVNTTKDLDGPGRGLRVVGSLPLLDGQNGHTFWPFSRMDDRSLEVVLNFSVDSIRAALLYHRSNEKIKVVMITSAQGQEGRSTLASQLAVSMARSGLRTVLVDGDIRNPQQHLVFGVGGDHGFCEVLRGNQSIAQAVQQTAVADLNVMASGRFDQASMQALSSERARAVFTDLRSQFDFVIIDVGPVLTSADAMLVGQQVDTTLISVRRDVSQLPKIYAACDRLRTVGVHVMGCVVNGAGTEIRPNELRAAASAPALPQPEMQTAE